jgi:hypothetical protein
MNSEGMAMLSISELTRITSRDACFRYGQLKRKHDHKEGKYQHYRARLQPQIKVCSCHKAGKFIPRFHAASQGFHGRNLRSLHQVKVQNMKTCLSSRAFFIPTGYKYRVFQKELYNGIANFTVWRVLRKRLHLKAFKLYIVQGLFQRDCRPMVSEELLYRSNEAY